LETTLRHQKICQKKTKKYLQEKPQKIYLKQKNLKNIMTKVKIPPEDRIYDRDGYWLRAACVCVKDHSENEVLLISSSRHEGCWIIPGGKMEPKDQARPEFSAMREALEEGGAVGRLGRCLGTFDNTERRHRTKVFVLYVNRLADEFEEKDVRKRKWFSLEEAQKMLYAFKPIQAKYLVALKQSKSSTLQQSSDHDNSSQDGKFGCPDRTVLSGPDTQIISPVEPYKNPRS